MKTNGEGEERKINEKTKGQKRKGELDPIQGTDIVIVKSKQTQTSKFCKVKFIRETQRHLCMLQHVVKAEVLDFILSGMDLLG